MQEEQKHQLLQNFRDSVVELDAFTHQHGHDLLQHRGLTLIETKISEIVTEEQQDGKFEISRSFYEQMIQRLK